MTLPNSQSEQVHFKNKTTTSPTAKIVNSLYYQPTVTVLFVPSFHFTKFLTFNAAGGYLTPPYQAHWSVACMYRHIRNSNRHLAHKICLIPQTILETPISVFPHALHYLIKESVIRKTDV